LDWKRGAKPRYEPHTQRISTIIEDWTALKTRMNTVSVALFMPNVALPKVTYPAPSAGLLSMISF
jgi:hypothetical protein